MPTKGNSNPIYSRIGIGIFLMGIILGVFSMKYQFNNLIILGFALFISGLGLISFGLTKVDIKEDREYQSFTRNTSKIFLVVLPLIIILPVLGLFVPVLSTISMIFLFILLLLFPLFDVYFYYKTCKYAKKVNARMSPDEKRKQMTILIICIMLGLLLWYAINYVILSKFVFD